MKIDKNYLHEMYNATSTDDGKGDLETYENWLERQLISRIEIIEQLSKPDVSGTLLNFLRWLRDNPKFNDKTFSEIIKEYLKFNNDR